MSLPVRWTAAAALAGVALLAAAPSAPAQARPLLPGPRAASGAAAGAPNLNALTSQGVGRAPGVTLVTPNVFQNAVNPNFQVAPGLSLPQAAFNAKVIGNALSAVPPSALGISPFSPLTVGSFGGGALATSPYAGLGGLATGGYGGFGGGGSLSTNPYYSSLGGLSGFPGDGSGGGYGGYGGYYEDPYAGYLRGVATVTSAQGQFLSQVQQARLLQTQADMSKLDLRRRIAEEAAIERKNWLNPETQRVKDLETAYTRATREPPFTEVLSGQALNDLYVHAANLQEKGKVQGVRGPNVPLDEDLLKQVNFTGAGSAGSIALLKDRGRLNWPLVLQSPEYDEARRRMTTLAADAVGQVKLNNPVGAATLRDMQADVRRLNETLMHNIGEVSPSEYVEAKRFLNGLESAVKALQDPNVGNQVNQKWQPRARNVAELVDFMSQNGIRFAPATGGDEPAYRHLYQRLVAYDAALSSDPNLQTAAKPSAPR